jgi:uncharacterized membrane protein YGL010W
MRNINEWLAEYGASHQHPTNKLLHWLCVPPIVWTVMGFVSLIPVPTTLATAVPGFNWLYMLAAVALTYYALLSPKLALGMLPIFMVMIALLWLARLLPWPLWLTCAAVFILAWIGQFIGHGVEGTRPSFFKDLQFLMIGPLWLLAFVYRAFGIRFTRAQP